VPQILNISKFCLRHGTHPRTLHVLSRTPHARVRRLPAMARSDACHCGNKSRASVSAP